MKTFSRQEILYGSSFETSEVAVVMTMGFIDDVDDSLGRKRQR